jgi:hypothetical protein
MQQHLLRLKSLRFPERFLVRAWRSAIEIEKGRHADWRYLRHKVAAVAFNERMAKIAGIDEWVLDHMLYAWHSRRSECQNES